MIAELRVSRICRDLLSPEREKERENPPKGGVKKRESLMEDEGEGGGGVENEGPAEQVCQNRGQL